MCVNAVVRLMLKWPGRAEDSWDGGVDGSGEFGTFYA